MPNNFALFQEAIHHCRWKKVLYNVLQEINLSDYKNKSFEKIIYAVYTICNNVKGLGMLATYDITAAICRFYNINIDRVYIIGGGPRRAVKLLHIKTKIHQINGIKIKYIDIADGIKAFDATGYKIDEKIRNNKNGDILETYLCNWQKSQ